ncbi:hypothetical protein [Micromonospora endolithica]|uniref:Uncharacterized protein n=1 Tax=Micromonospora endolithica TaxID=230091 RepID=A0A3A9ZSQ5_9ACTN|nr:hypothetical protein [Micromonospora endolithica]RKN51163.1 hypothetical protein D7223_05510 [Micromonospora endolithica]TWJ22368.1 hypothetical protein JD76_02483 [Micromonospora endolithica]
MTAVAVTAFGLAWWLGLYLLARNPRQPVLCRAGVGLLAYALVLACDGLAVAAQGAVARRLTEVGGGLAHLPALAWTGVLLALLPEPVALRARLDRAWRLVAPVLGATLVALGATGSLTGAPARTVAGAAVLLPLLGVYVLVLRHRRALRPAGPAGVTVVVTLLLGLGLSLVLLPGDLLPRAVALGAVGLDLALLGVAVAAFDAFAEGETLRADMARSALAAGVATALFGGQVAVALLVAPRAGTAVVALLFGTVAAAIAVQVLASPFQNALDRLVFTGSPTVARTRAELRSAADALPRRDDATRLAALDEAEFARLTRRALSHYGDLGRLVASPLTAHPEIDKRLAARGVDDQPVERAAELKGLLLESIVRLKPRDGEFGTSAEWRYYNALYFSYVVGIRPYRRHVETRGLDTPGREALGWFRRDVPERTLHNWQNAAARLVATDLRSRL